MLSIRFFFLLTPPNSQSRDETAGREPACQYEVSIAVSEDLAEIYGQSSNCEANGKDERHDDGDPQGILCRDGASRIGQRIQKSFEHRLTSGLRTT